MPYNNQILAIEHKQLEYNAGQVDELYEIKVRK